MAFLFCSSGLRFRPLVLGLLSMVLFLSSPSFANLEEVKGLITYHWYDQAWQALQSYPPDDEEVLFLKAKTLLGLKKYEESLELFKNLSLEATDKEMRQESAMKEAIVLVRLKRYPEALHIYKDLLHHFKTGKMGKKLTWHAFKVALESKDFEEGLKMLRNLSGAEVFWWRGWCYFRLGQQERAIRQWNLVTKRSPFYPGALYWKGMALHDGNILQTLVKQYPMSYYGFLALFELSLALPPEGEGVHRWQLEEKYPRHYREWIEKNAKRNGLDPNLIFAVIFQESHFREEVVSPVGAIGLMQLMPQTALKLVQASQMKYFHLPELFNADVNIRLGTLYIKFLKKLFSSDVSNTVAAYNSGEEAVSRWLSLRKGESDAVFIEEIPFDETQQYVKKVLTAAWIYHWLYEGSLPDFLKLTPP